MIDAIDNNATKIAHNHDGTPGNGSKIAAANITVADTGNNYTATDVEGALTELFTNVSNGKTAVASAITGKGVAASGSDTFSQLGTKIGQISTGTGNAVAADVLTGKTFTNGISAGITGTMPNNGAATITPSGTGPVMIPAGYHNGSGTVAQVTVPAANVKSGTTIAGVVGTMADRGAVTITPSASSQAIAAGYHNGSGTVAAVTVPAANVLTGTTIAGTAGTMPNRGATSFTPSIGNQAILAGYHNGSGVVSGDPNLIGANINTGITIFGVAGTSSRKRFANGSGTAIFNNNPKFTVSGLAFLPTIVIVEWRAWDMNQNYRQVHYAGQNYANNNTASMTVFANGFSLLNSQGATYDFTAYWIAIE